MVFRHRAARSLSTGVETSGMVTSGPGIFSMTSVRVHDLLGRGLKLLIVRSWLALICLMSGRRSALSQCVGATPGRELFERLGWES